MNAYFFFLYGRGVGVDLRGKVRAFYLSAILPQFSVWGFLLRVNSVADTPSILCSYQRFIVLLLCFSQYQTAMNVGIGDVG